MDNKEDDNLIKSLKETLSKLNYEQLEELLCKQVKNNLKLKEQLLRLSKEEN